MRTTSSDVPIIILTLIVLVLVGLSVFFGFFWGSDCCHDSREAHGGVVNISTSLAAVFIAHGQSNSECNIFPATLPDNRDVDVLVYYSGETYEYTHPMSGSHTTGMGCPYYELGRRYLERVGLAENSSIVFALTGCGGHSVARLKECEYYLKETMRGIINKYGRLDGILYHQGESDSIASTPPTIYSAMLTSMINTANLIYPTNWYIARATACCGVGRDEALRTAQWSIDGTFRGPDTDVLAPCESRWDECHFSLSNVPNITEGWVDAVVNPIPAD